MIHLILLANFLITAHPHDCDKELIAAMEHVESRGNTFAVSPAGARGLLQVIPKWSKYPAWALYIPAVNRREGCRIYKRWLGRAEGMPTLALQAYNGGNVGLQDECSRCRTYALHVLERMEVGHGPG